MKELIFKCEKKMVEFGFSETDVYKSRLVDELREIEIQKEDKYFLDLEKNGKKFPNENNLLVPYLLGICDEFDINKTSIFINGEWPDIDVDFVAEVRTYLKDKYTREQFGNDHVCNIATYTTFGLRSSLIDVSRIFSLDRSEIIKLTTSLGIKDDEGEVLQWDKAVELYDELREYLERYPEVGDAAKRLLHRNRNMGQHASGLIISGVPISDFVPLVMPKGASVPAAAWVEGLHGTDLGAVGLVKFDFLSLDGNMKIALACKLVKERHGVAVSALPGKGNWSDLSYLEDKKALDMADKGDLKMIFQFDGSEGIRRLTKDGGVTRFDDLVAYAALFRPGPMKKVRTTLSDGKVVTSPSMADMYVSRKRGKEEYDIHPILKPALERTYGVIIYQESIMQILNLVGKIPLRDCEAVRKAISKKKVDKFKKYQEMFIENGQEILGWTKEELEKLWEQIEAFAGYGFNKCLVGSTMIVDSNGRRHTIRELYKNKNKIKVHSLDDKHKLVSRDVTDVVCNGKKPVFELTTRLGKKITTTGNHPFLTFNGWKNLENLKVGEYIASPRHINVRGGTSLPKHEIISMAGLLSEGNTCHPSSLYFYNNDKVLIDDFAESISKFPNTIAKIYTRKNSNKNEVCANTGAIYQKGHRPWNSKDYVKPSKSDAYYWAEKHKILDCKATQKFVPEEFFQLADDSLALFLGRIWAGDGYVWSEKFTTNPYYATSSHQLAIDIQTLLLRFEIISKLSKKKFNYKYKGNAEIKVGYTVSLCGNNSISNFVKFIGPNILSKEKEVDALSLQTHHDSCKDLIPYEVMKLIDKERKLVGYTWSELSKDAKVSDRIFHAARTKKGIFRSTLRKIASKLESNELYDIANSDIFWDEVVSIEFKGIEETYDLTVDNDHNFIANGVIVHNSHSVAYSYISSRMLYLKCHYPIEFYTAFLSCFNATGPKDYQKLKDYKLEVERHGCHIEPIDLNKSGQDFTIHDDKIYYGFSKLKGIGEAQAKRIIDNQPYAGFEDFLRRFGTDAKVVQALISLGMFKEADPLTLYKFYETYKGSGKKIMDREKRHQKRLNHFRMLISKLKDQNAPESDIKEAVSKAIECRQTYLAKCKAQDITLDNFVPPDNIKITPKFLAFLENKELAEMEYYGFAWSHPIGKYKEHNREHTASNAMNHDIYPIEVIIESVNQKKSKKGNTYYVLQGQDAESARCYITLWNDDYERFKDRLVTGSAIRIVVKPPDGKFGGFTIAPTANRWKPPPKEQDFRIRVLS